MSYEKGEELAEKAEGIQKAIDALKAIESKEEFREKIKIHKKQKGRKFKEFLDEISG